MSSTTISGRLPLPVTQPEVSRQPAPVQAKASKTLVQRHPLVTFYILAFAISWTAILLVIGGPANFPGTSETIGKLFLSVMLGWLAGPSVASIVTIGLVSGRSGYRDLLDRLLRWRVGLRWYAAALLTAPLVYAILCVGLSQFRPEFASSILVTSDRTGLLLMGLAYGLLGGGFLEELGWTGFAVPTLRRHHGALATGLIAGLLWGAYHFSVIFWSTSPSPSGRLGLAILVVQLFAWLPAYRVLMVWVYDHTQSLLVAMLMHASVTAGMLILQPAGMAGETLLIWLVIFAAAWWTIVAAVAIISRLRSRASTEPDRMLVRHLITSHNRKSATCLGYSDRRQQFVRRCSGRLGSGCRASETFDGEVDTE